MLKCTVAWAQLTVGISSLILAHTVIPLPHFESKWLSSLWSYLSSIQAGIKLDDPCIPALQRQGDSYIMDHVLDSQVFSPMEVRHIIYCRLYLQAIMISDLATTDGTSLDQSKFMGMFSLKSSCTTWLTVHQEYPSPKAWKTWQRANLLWSHRGVRLKFHYSNGYTPRLHSEVDMRRTNIVLACGYVTAHLIHT
jgi:hypothetical protein